MRSWIGLLMGCSLVGAVTGCGSDALPSGMMGTYTRQDVEPGAVARVRVAEMTVTATGMAFTGGPGSALFKQLKCSDEASCRFTTESGCEGTISRDPSGALVIVAVGECEGWSGKWTPGKAADVAAAASASASAAPATSAATVSPPAQDAPVPQAGTVPTGVATATATASPTASGTATPSGTATASSTASSTVTGPPAVDVSCLAKCNNASFACVKECKVADFECMAGCSAAVTECARKCP